MYKNCSILLRKVWYIVITVTTLHNKMSSTDKKYRKVMQIFVVIVLMGFAVWCVVEYKLTPKKYCLKSSWGETHCTYNEEEYVKWMENIGVR